VQVDPEASKVDRGNFLFLNAETGEVQHRIPPSQRLRLKREGFRRLLMEDLAVQVPTCPFLLLLFLHARDGVVTDRW